ncbi:lecithin retinol acyltransferase family protein [Salmonella sp. s54395]
MERAKQKIGSEVLCYRIMGNNCKSFARWCKTGTLPCSITSVEGYD